MGLRSSVAERCTQHTVEFSLHVKLKAISTLEQVIVDKQKHQVLDITQGYKLELNTPYSVFRSSGHKLRNERSIKKNEEHQE